MTAAWLDKAALVVGLKSNIQRAVGARNFFVPEATTARQSRRGISVGSYTVPRGTKMDFQLAQPLKL